MDGKLKTLSLPHQESMNGAERSLEEFTLHCQLRKTSSRVRQLAPDYVNNRSAEL